MKWGPPDKGDPRYGRQSGDYRIGKCTVDDGALCTLYRLWYKYDDLGIFADFESAKEAAENHEATIQSAK